MNKTIVNIERISGCFPKLNIAKSGFYNFESDAFNHSATLPAESAMIETLKSGAVNLNPVNNPRLTIFRRFSNVIIRSIKIRPNFMAAKSAEKSVEKVVAETKASATRARELDAAISSITKTYGDGAIMRLGDAQAHVKIDVIPTGALALDLALGVGGLPRGRVIEIYGPESSGKTTLMLHVIANAQKNRRPRSVH